MSKIIKKPAFLGWLTFVIFVLAIIAVAVISLQTKKTHEPPITVAHNSFTDTHQSIENFAAISQDDYQKFITAASALDGLTPAQKTEVLAKLGCQNAIDQNMQGYRSAESGATFKMEEVRKLGAEPKYMVHTAENLVLSVDKVSGRLSRAVKNTADDSQLFTKENVKDGAGADKGTVMFTFTLSSNVKSALQYEHESLSLRPLNTATTPPSPMGRGQEFVLDPNLKGELLDASALTLGYRMAPGIGAPELQNVGAVAMCGAGSTSASTKITSSSSAASAGGSDSGLGSLTQSQLENAIKTAMASVSSYNQITGGMQPGTQNNPFANKPLRVNLDLSGLGGQSSTPASPMSSIVSGFADVPVKNGGQCGMKTEAFTDMASGSGTGQVRSLIQAWDAAQNPGDETDMGGFPTAAGKLGNALRGKMVSCPKIDRTQYYTERQLSQCAGCTPDPYLRGQLGGTVYS